MKYLSPGTCSVAEDFGNYQYSPLRSRENSIHVIFRLPDQTVATRRVPVFTIRPTITTCWPHPSSGYVAAASTNKATNKYCGSRYSQSGCPSTYCLHSIWAHRCPLSYNGPCSVLGSRVDFKEIDCYNEVTWLSSFSIILQGNLVDTWCLRITIYLSTIMCSRPEDVFILDR